MMNKIADLIGSVGGNQTPAPTLPQTANTIVLSTPVAPKPNSYVETRKFNVCFKHQFDLVNSQCEAGLLHVKRTCSFVESILRSLDHSADANKQTSELTTRWQQEPLHDEMSHYVHACAMIGEVMLHTYNAHEKFRKAAQNDCVNPLYAFYKSSQARRREVTKDYQRMLANWNSIESDLGKERRDCAKAYTELRLAQDALLKERGSKDEEKALKKVRSAKETAFKKFQTFEKNYEKVLGVQENNDTNLLPQLIDNLENIERERLSFLNEYMMKFQGLFNAYTIELKTNTDLINKVTPALQAEKSVTTLMDKWAKAFGSPPPLVPIRYDLPCTSAAIQNEQLPHDSAPVMAYLNNPPIASAAAAASAAATSAATSTSSPPRTNAPAPFPTPAGTTRTPAPLPVPAARTPAPLPVAAHPTGNNNNNNAAAAAATAAAATPASVRVGPPPPPPPAASATAPPPAPPASTTTSAAAAAAPPPLPVAVTPAANASAPPAPSAPTPAATTAPTITVTPPTPAVAAATPVAASTAAPASSAHAATVVPPSAAGGLFSKNNRAPAPALPQKRKPKAAGDPDISVESLPPPPPPPQTRVSVTSNVYRASIVKPAPRNSILRQSINLGTLGNAAQNHPASPSRKASALGPPRLSVLHAVPAASDEAVAEAVDALHRRGTRQSFADLSKQSSSSSSPSSLEVTKETSSETNSRNQHRLSLFGVALAPTQADSNAPDVAVAADAPAAQPTRVSVSGKLPPPLPGASQPATTATLPPPLPTATRLSISGNATAASSAAAPASVAAAVVFHSASPATSTVVLDESTVARATAASPPPTEAAPVAPAASSSPDAEAELARQQAQAEAEYQQQLREYEQQKAAWDEQQRLQQEHEAQQQREHEQKYDQDAPEVAAAGDSAAQAAPGEGEGVADGRWATALYNFELNEDTSDIHYVKFNASDRILVYQWEGEWFYGETENGDVGFFAANYVQMDDATDDGSAQQPQA